MAASAKSVGAWAASNTTIQAITLPAHAAGDMLVVVAACKPYTADPTLIGVITGWTRLYSYADGTVDNGNGTGSVRQVLFYKVAASSSETNPTISWGTTSAPGIAVPCVLQKGAGDTWDTPLYANGNTNEATSISVSLSDPGIAAGGIGLVIHTTRDNSALTVPNWTQSGATLGTLTEWPATAISATTSNDMAGDMAYRTVTAAGSGNITATGTQAAAETGVTSLVFFGVTTTPTLVLPLITSTPDAYAPSSIANESTVMALPLADSTPDAFAPTLAAGGYTLTLPLADSTPDAYAPTIRGISAVVLPLAGGDPAIYAPALSVVLAVPLIDAGNAAYAPTIAPAPYPITLPLVDAGAAIYAPTLTGGSGGAQSLTLPVVESLPDAYAPTLTAKYLLDLPLVESTPAIYAPTVAPGAYTLVLPTAEATPDAYAPVLVPAAVTLTLPLAGDDPAIYAPTLEGLSTQVVVLPLVETSPDAYAPAITKASVVIAGVTRSANGSPLPSCTVLVYRSDTNELVTSTSSGRGGLLSARARLAIWRSISPTAEAISSSASRPASTKVGSNWWQK